MSRQQRHFPACVALGLAMGFATLAAPPLAAFDSTSDGSDGALDLSASPPGVVVFDPASFDPPLDTDGDNVFHFTTITIPSGVEVVFEARKLRYTPVHWLASGDVVIEGTLNLRGATGHDPGERHYSEPGPGGFHGGLGQRNAQGATSGFGPGAGRGGGSPGAGSHATRPGGNSGPVYGNRFLLPLAGGSGGGGRNPFTGSLGRGGGAGGGAILIASSTSVQLDGTIDARGGGGETGGAGGGVRILAPLFQGNGTVTVDGGGGNQRGGRGWIRIESTERTFTGSLAGVAAVVTLPPSPNFLPQPGPRVRITRIGGVDVSPTPGGRFELPDAVIDTADPVTVEIATEQIPPDTVVTLLLVTEDSADQTAMTTPLAGTLESGTASAEVTFSSGFTRVFLRATW